MLETVLSKGQKDEGRDHRGGVAQLGEHLLCKQGVIGSNPFISTNFLSVKESWTKKAQAFRRRSGPEPEPNEPYGLIAQLVRARA